MVQLRANLASLISHENTHPLHSYRNRFPRLRGSHDAKRHRSTGSKTANSPRCPALSTGKLPGGTPPSDAQRPSGERGQGLVYSARQNPSRNRREKSEHDCHRWKKSLDLLSELSTAGSLRSGKAPYY